MAHKRKRIFDGLYAQLEETDGNVVLFSARGEPSVIFEITNPVQQLCTDAQQYMLFHDVLSNILQTIGEGYALQKQDILCRQAYHHDVPDDAEFLTRSYFRYFEGREFTEIRTFLILTQEAQRSQFIQYDPKRWLDFHAKVSKTDDILTEKHIRHRKLGKEEVSEYCHRFMAFQFRHGPFSMTNFKASDEYLRTGDRIIRSYPLVDIDEINLPSMVKPYTQMNINGYGIATDLLSFLTGVPYSDCVVFNQVIQIPGQRKLLRKLQAKAKRHGSMPDPSNRIAKADIEEVLDRLAVDSTMLVYCNFNILVSCPPDKVTPVTSFLETKLYECGIMPSRTAYNQLELFMDSFPGNGYAFNPDYDLFLTLSDAALCFFFKEHLKESEDTPLTTYDTDRQGLPVCIDITGKEGKKKMTDNANFFCIGPSGSGKSFHMNSVVRQLLEQNTDVVMVDTGDSYEGICGYYKGTYISYSKEKPISMNPFKVTKEEYELNFGEKKNFLKSLIFLIFKGNAFPSKIEDMLINQTIVEYYEAYFNPFEKFSDSEREALRQKLLVAAKMEDDYEQYTHSMEDIDKNNFSEIYKKYVMTAYSAAMQVVHNEADADDIAQETMVKLYLNIDALDEDRVEGWVRVAAKNLGIDYQRKAQRFDWNELDEDLRAEEMELPTLAEEEKQERNHFFREVMDALKDHDESGYYITREIKVHERSEKEVASEMGITIGNLRVKMTRTKKWLCQHFADKARERGFL